MNDQLKESLFVVTLVFYKWFSDVWVRLQLCYSACKRGMMGAVGERKTLSVLTPVSHNLLETGFCVFSPQVIMPVGRLTDTYLENCPRHPGT